MTITRSLQRRLQAYRRRLAQIQRTINLYAVARFVMFVLLLATFSFIFGKWAVYGAAGFLISCGAFLYLMVRQDRCYRFKERLEVSIQLLEDDLARAEWRFGDIQRPQSLTFPAAHPFAHDLDLTGSLSLLALVDTTYHRQAQALLESWINEPSPVDTLRARQAAVADLTGKRRFRQQLALSAAFGKVPDLRADSFKDWLELPDPWTVQPWVYFLGRLAALVTTSVVSLHFFAGIQIPYLPWFPVLLVNLTFFFVLDRAHRSFNLGFMRHGKAIAAVCAAIHTLEKTPFSAPALQEIKSRLLIDGKKAGKHLTYLGELHEYLAYRTNGFAHLLLNGFFLWDQHYLYRLAGWRRKYGSYLPIWTQAIFEVEALSAIANYRQLFGGPFPELVPGDVIHVEAIQLGHPCLPASTRVGNNYQLTQRGVLHLVTGSNMSGKSTFLRTVGVNMVLARLGAPVCATAMTCSLPRLWTSIHIQDSLAQGVSYFYAEVRRIKMILDEILADPRPVFYLMDEILKGTNSRERLIATRAMVYFLLEHGASGLITTHDVEMLGIVKERPNAITNYHFQERVEHDEMFFDYRLKNGELTSTNALRVMRHAGVPLHFDE